jgi:hypothetical protein
MRAQSILYGHDKDGVRHADIILRRADRGRSEAWIVEEKCGAERAELPAPDASRLPANRPALVS